MHSSKTYYPHRPPPWRRHAACGAATLGSAGELRSPESVARAPRRLMPALQGGVGRRRILTGVDAAPQAVL